VLGLLPPALLGRLIAGPQTMGLAIVMICFLNFVVQSLIQPRFVGDAVVLSVTVTFLSLAFWAWLLGSLGATAPAAHPVAVPPAHPGLSCGPSTPLRALRRAVVHPFRAKPTPGSTATIALPDPS
jgi:hypothetical protein